MYYFFVIYTIYAFLLVFYILYFFVVVATSVVDMDDIFESQLLSYARQITMGMVRQVPVVYNLCACLC